MATVLVIDGTTINLDAGEAFLGRFTSYAKDGYPSLTIYRRGGALEIPGSDPWAAKVVTLTCDGTLVFTGDVVSGPENEFANIGNVQAYQCLGLRHRGDKIPFTNQNNGLDQAGFNLQPEDPNYVVAFAGQTVGQILTTVLTWDTNATNLNALGLGAYVSPSPTPWTLPSATVADLAAMTVICPQPVSIGGEKFLGAIEGFLDTYAPNHIFFVDPTGQFRFFDQRTSYTNHTFTLGTDPVDPANLSLSRRYGDCFQRVLVRGQPVVKPVLVSLQNGGLTEDFGYTLGGTTFTNAQAKSNYVSSQSEQPGTASDTGTCTCPSTTTVTVTSGSSSKTWAANYWNGAYLFVWYSVGTGINQGWSSQIVANTVLSAGGTSTLTLSEALPITNYDHYSIYGIMQGPQVVYRKYKITNTTMASALAQQFQAPVPYVLANADAATLVSSPTGSVCWPGIPGNEVVAPFKVDPASGHIYFYQPTYQIAGNSAPFDVRALLAVNTGQNQTVYAPDSGGPVYSGTSHTVEGLAYSLVVTVDQWRDPGQEPQMNAYAAEVLASVQDTFVEGSVTYYGLFDSALVPGLALSVTGNTYSTGWESLALPVQECEVEWDLSGGPIRTTMHCSNRRQALSSGEFLRPARTGQLLGGDVNLFGGLVPEYGVTASSLPGMLGGSQFVDEYNSMAGALGGESLSGGSQGQQQYQDQGLDQDFGESGGMMTQAEQDRAQRQMQASERQQIMEIMGG